MTAATAAPLLLSPPPSSAAKSHPQFSYPSKPPPLSRPLTKLSASSSPPPSRTSTLTATSSSAASGGAEEVIFFDGGAHYGDLVANLLLGFTLLWLPLTLAAVFRAFFLRYRFTNRRVTVISGLTGQDRSDFPYSVIQGVQTVPRFIGEWGDIVITLKDGTKVDLRSVPKFREIAAYCVEMTSGPKVAEEKRGGRARGF